jgi:anaerobic selenocysteine-containing dehydrogenase
MKKDLKQSYDASRREFLRGSAAAGVGAVVAANVPGTAAAAAEQQQTEDLLQKGYRLTDHIVEYYKTTAS